MILRQSTAVDVLIGQFTDLTNGYGGEVGESPTVILSKNGQALTAKSDATVPVHDASGYYNCELDTTDTNTIGSLFLVVDDTASARGVRHEFQVIEAAIYDALYLSGATGYNTAGQVSLLTATQTSIDAIETDTNELQTDWANGGRLDLLIDSMVAEVVTAAGEPAQGAPGVSASRGTKVDWLYKFLRNKKTQTATQLSLYDDAGTTVDTKATIASDGTTLTYGGQATGP